MTTRDVVVLGAGAIGTASAWRCAQRGLRVTVVDPDTAQGAWHTAAGMLAPVTELAYTEPELLPIGLESLRRYPAFAAELQQDADAVIGLRESGTLCAAYDAADLQALRDVHAFATRLDVPAELVSSRELRRLEPATAAGLAGGLHAAGDHSVDPRALHRALHTAARRRGVEFVTAVPELVIDAGRITGVRLDDATFLGAAHVVLAAGSWSPRVAGLPAEVAIPVRPVKGQTLRLRLPDQPLRHVLRGLVRGKHCYLVPRDDGRIVVGASVEEAGYDTRPRAGAVYELLRDAQMLLPELEEAVLDEICTGLRPATPDNLPLIGPTAVDGVLLATGNYRNGILHTPLMADAVAALVAGDPLPSLLARCTPERFAAVRS